MLAYRYRLYPTKAQASVLEEAFAICLNVYNSLLHGRTVLYETTGKSPSWAQQSREVTSWKPNHAELSTINAQVLQNVVRRVDLAFQAFFRRVKAGEKPGYPRLKGKGQYDSITYPQHEGGFSFFQGRLRLSKIGDVSIHLHRPVKGKIKTCTVRRMSTGKWFACFSCEVEPEHLEPSKEEIGIDVGLKTFAALSNGEFIENPHFFRKDEKALAKAHRRFDKVKNNHRSKTRKNAKKIVAHIHERIKHRRHNFVHQTARKLINRFGVIAVENLNIKGVVKNHCLAKSISDASWSMFRNILTMKAEYAGRLVVAVPPQYTSQICSGCGNIQKKPLSVRTHRCLGCGLVLDRDTNASINIMTLGQQSLPALTG